MTNRTRELFDFAQMEPVMVADMRSMLRDCDEDEIMHVEDVATNLLAAIATLGTPDNDEAEFL